jgi:hypothetical protein
MAVFVVARVGSGASSNDSKKDRSLLFIYIICLPEKGEHILATQKSGVAIKRKRMKIKLLL